jgi:hypothetical protein
MSSEETASFCSSNESLTSCASALITLGGISVAGELGG